MRSIAGKCRDGAQVRRLLALAMVLEGHSRAEAAARKGMDRQVPRDWVHRYNEGGIEALVSSTSPGPTPRLNADQMKQLREIVLAGPDPQVHHVMRCRCVDQRDEVARRLSVTVDEDTIGKWLRKLKLTGLQPRPYHPK